MREQIRDKERLNHIIESIDNIFEFTENLKFTDFENNKMLKFAVIKNLEIIGEASNLLTKELKEKHNKIQWHLIIGLRNVLVHGYYQISNSIIWNTITDDLLSFKTKIENIKNNI
ncbi:MAG: DUF86 domain-containing protein [Bacteroidales bacterium]|nr:DUF86 domain-containing protein [Bacteroidales bacterium]